MSGLRAYRAEDQPDLLRLWWSSWHSIAPGLTHPVPFEAWEARWLGEIVPAQAIVVAEEEGRVVGFAALHLANRELTQLFVAPACQRRGIGEQLLGWAKATQPDGFTLLTLIENRASRAFYLRHGFIEGAVRVSTIHGRPVIECRWAP